MKLNINDYSLSEIEKVLRLLFGEDWKTAEIEDRDYPFVKHDGFFNKGNIPIKIQYTKEDIFIWNKNGRIYQNGQFATAKITEIPEKYVVKDEATFLEPITGYSGCNILSFEGYQYLTEWQHKELSNAPKVGDFGMFYGNSGNEVGYLAKIDNTSKTPFFDKDGHSWNNFSPIKDKKHIEIIKSYLK